MKVILFFIGIFISILGYSQNVSFTKDFELFSIRMDKKGVFFIPKEAELKRCIGKEEINFQNKIYLNEHARFIEYGINIDQKFIQNDSMMRDMFYSNNMDNASIIEIKNNKLMVSINVQFYEARIKLDDKGNILKDPNGENIVEDFKREELAFFLYDLKNKKTLVDDTLSRIEEITAGGYFLRNSSKLACDDCKFSLIDFEGNQLFPWVEVNEILKNREWLFKLHPEAQAFYGIESSKETIYNQYCYIDKKGKSHLHTFNNFFRFAFKESTDFYFSDYYHSYIKNDTILIAMGEAMVKKYVGFVSPVSFQLFSDSIGPDKSKNYIPFDTTKIFLMDFSNFYIYTQPAITNIGNIPSKIGTGTYNSTYLDSLDENALPVLGITSEQEGRLVVFNKKTKSLVNEFLNSHLIDFNHNYYLIGNRTAIFDDKNVKMNYEYIIFDKDFKEIKRTKDKMEFYRLK